MNSTPFINRQDELRALHQELSLTCRHGSRLVLLAAPAGMGKTALCRHFGRTIAAEVDFVAGRGWDNRAAVPYHALREALKPLYTQQQSGLSPSANPHLETFFGNEAGSQIEALSANLLFHGLAEFLNNQTNERPLCVFLDDLQWADEGTLEWLDFALHQMEQAPVLWIGTYRSEEAASVASLLDRRERWTRAGRLSELSLAPLQPEHLAELGLQIDPDFPWNADVVEEIYQHSGGLPLLAVEEMRAIVQGERDLPQGLALIRHKLRRLKENERKLVQQAAVIGEQFQVESLAAALKKDPLTTARALQHLVDDEALLIAEEDGFRFAHGRFREVLLDEMSPELRRLYHARLAQANQHLLPAERAYHLVFSGEVKKGAQALLLEGDRAREQAAWRDAQRYYAEALQLTRDHDAEPALKREAYERMGDLHLNDAEEPEIARGYYEAAMRWATAPREQALLLCRLAETYALSPPALERLEDAARLLDKSADISIRDWIYFRRMTHTKELGVQPGYRQRFWALGRAAISHNDLPHDLISRAHKTLSWFGALFDHSEVARLATRLEELPANSWSRAEHLINLIQSYRVVGQMDNALSSAREARDIVKILGRHHVATGLLIESGLYLLDMGRFAESRRALLDSLEQSPSTQQQLDAYLLLCKGWVYDRDSRGLEWARNALRTALEGRLEYATADVPLGNWPHHFGIVERIFATAGQEQTFRREIDRIERSLRQAGYRADMTWYVDEALQREAVSATEAIGNWVWSTGHERAEALVEGDDFVFRALPIQGFSHMDMPRALCRVRGDFTLQATIHAGSDVEAGMQRCRSRVAEGQQEKLTLGGGGLLVFLNPSNALRLFAHTCEPGEVLLETRTDSLRDTHGRGFLGGDSLCLRLEKRGNLFSAYIACQGGDWYFCGQVDLPGWDEIHIGLYGENIVSLYPALVERAETRFSDIRLQAIQATHPESMPHEPACTLPEPLFASDFPEMVSQSAPMQKVLEQVRRQAQSELPVLVQGETGTGKELVARALHRLSKRKDGPFIALNCAAIAPDLLERELFGHVRGAFTGAYESRGGLFQAADGGVLFLDEIGEASPAFQTRLLRVLEDGAIRRIGTQTTHQVDVRIIAASNRNLVELVAKKDFRQDLYYRLRGAFIDLPPLTKRRCDVLPLVAHALGQWARQRDMPIPSISEKAVDALKGHNWPGNVRELIHEVQRAAEEAREEMIGIKHISVTAPVSTAPTAGDQTQFIVEALSLHKGNISAAARHLKISRPTLYRRLRELGLRAADYK